MTTVDDILGSRPAPLSERAHRAYQAVLQEAQRRREQERDDLEADAFAFMQHTLQLSPAELADVEPVRSSYYAKRATPRRSRRKTRRVC